MRQHSVATSWSRDVNINKIKTLRRLAHLSNLLSTCDHRHAFITY